MSAAGRAAEWGSAGCLTTFTTTGRTALRLARERPRLPTLALTPHPATARRLALVWGVESRIVEQLSDPEDLAQVAVDVAAALGLAGPGRPVLILAGAPLGSLAPANFLRIGRVPDA